MSVIIILTGILMLGLTIFGLSIPAIRDAETLLVDCTGPEKLEPVPEC